MKGASALYIQWSSRNGNAMQFRLNASRISNHNSAQLVTSTESHQSPAARKDTSGSIHRLDVKSRSRLVHLKTNARNKEESMRAGCERGARVHRPPPRAAVQFVHFKCTQRRDEEVAPALTKLTCPSQRRLTFIGQTRWNFRCM